MVLRQLCFAGFVAGLAYFALKCCKTEKVTLEEDGWFGEGKPVKEDTGIKPFKVEVPEQVLEDLRRRLSHSRISHSHLEDSNDFWYGFNNVYLEELKNYWLSHYDWRKHEAAINAFSHYTTQIEGIKVHFIRSTPPSGYKVVYPLLIVHGWPGNVYEFYKMLPLLSDPKKHGINVDFAFEVIAPSIPGYGWSSAPKKTGFSQITTARIFRKLMERVGFKRFYVQGGDWGSLVVSNLAKLYPENVIGLHLNMIAVNPLASPCAFIKSVLASIFPKWFIASPQLQDYNVGKKFLTIIAESGYMHIQATKPDTVGTALNDSPIGLAAYIIEKFSSWTNLENRALPDGGLNKKFTKDELITMVMIYWVNGNIVPSQRYYKEHFLDTRNEAITKQYASVPTAHASGLNEMFDRTPPELTSLFYNLTHYTEIPDMGHFAAFEKPVELARDIFDFAKSLQKTN